MSKRIAILTLTSLMDKLNKTSVSAPCVGRMLLISIISVSTSVHSTQVHRRGISVLTVLLTEVIPNSIGAFTQDRSRITASAGRSTSSTCLIKQVLYKDTCSLIQERSPIIAHNETSEKSFNLQSDLKKNNQRMYTGEKLYQCSHCGKK